MLELKNINIGYGKRNVLEDISLSFYPGLHYLLGLNGSGKSSLLHAIAGLIDFEGEILLDQQSLALIRPKDLAKKISFVAQRFSGSFHFTVSEFVLTGRFPYLNWLGTYTREDQDLAHQALEKLHLTPFINRSLDTLSGGELQRVCIARALCQATPIILLDEPCQSLDPRSKIMISEMLEQLASEGKCLICSTHDLEIAKQQKASLIGLKGGNIWPKEGVNSVEWMDLYEE